MTSEREMSTIWNKLEISFVIVETYSRSRYLSRFTRVRHDRQFHDVQSRNFSLSPRFARHLAKILPKSYRFNERTVSFLFLFFLSRWARTRVCSVNRFIRFHSVDRGGGTVLVTEKVSARGWKTQKNGSSMVCGAVWWSEKGPTGEREKGSRLIEWKEGTRMLAEANITTEQRRWRWWRRRQGCRNDTKTRLLRV